MAVFYTVVAFAGGFAVGFHLFKFLASKFWQKSGRPMALALAAATFLVVLAEGYLPREWLAGTLLEALFLGFLGGFLLGAIRKGSFGSG